MKHFYTTVYLGLLLIFNTFLLLSVQAQEPVISFSYPGGFYDTPLVLRLSCSDSLSIHYTINGNNPKCSDLKYQHPLILNEDLFTSSNIYTIQTCHDSLWYPVTSIQKCIVIRASAFNSKGKQVGETTTNSYFIKSLGCDSHNLPIVSICTDSVSLFDQKFGIMAINKAKEIDSANYLQKGRQWERLCNFEFYEPNNQGINQQAGLRIHGESSRLVSQKGFRLYARKEYGNSRFQYEFFGHDELNSYKHLVLKPLKDGLIGEHICTPLAKSLNVDAPAVRPVILFLNGEYWGIYYLEERIDAQFIANHYGYKKNDINLIESWSGLVIDGESNSFKQMMQWFYQADLSDEKAYQHACSLIDIDNFIDYYCLELYSGNDSWPLSNMKCWQANGGKWRWIFIDGDGCICGYRNMLTSFKNESYESTLIITKLLDNQDFRDHFYSRIGYLITNEFEYKKTIKYLDLAYETISNEIDRHISRFGTPSSRNSFEFHKHQYISTFMYYRQLYLSKLVYYVYYCNDWEFKIAPRESQQRFKYNPNKRKPVYLLQMAKQFKDWKYVKLYRRYIKLYYKNERSRIKEKWKAKLDKLL